MGFRRTRRQDGGTSFIDLVFNKLYIFFIMFILAFVLVNPIANDGDVTSKAEIVVMVDWTQGDIDIDLWCKDPQGNIAWYGNKDIAFWHLDRDDLGNTNDIITIDGQDVMVIVNREVLTVRKLEVGEYQCSLHYFRAPDNSDPVAVTVDVQIVKLNPSVVTVWEGQRTLTKVKSEVSIGRWIITPSYELEGFETRDVKIVGQQGGTVQMPRSGRGPGQRQPPTFPPP